MLQKKYEGDKTMKKSIKVRFLAITLSLLLILFSTTIGISAEQSPVNLGTTVTFAVLAGSTITNTGNTVITGDAGRDVGLHPGSSFTGQETVEMSGGTVHINDAVAIQAKIDLQAAYDDAAGRTPTSLIPAELGGTTLVPGIYYSDEGYFTISSTETLTLDAEIDPEGVFIFLMSTTLIAEDGSNMNMVNGALYCRTFWQVGSSATLGEYSHFVGHILALTSISAQTGATIQGQLLALNGAVTLEANTITNGICIADITPEPTATPIPTPTATPIPTPTLTPIPTPTVTPEPTATPIPTPTVTPEPTATPIPTPTVTPEPTATPIPTPTVTPEPSATPEATPTHVPTTQPGDTGNTFFLGLFVLALAASIALLIAKRHVKQ